MDSYIVWDAVKFFHFSFHFSIFCNSPHIKPGYISIPNMSSQLSCLVFGGRGWIGGQLVSALRDRGHIVALAEARADDAAAVKAELDDLKPDRVICLVGRTHGPGCGTIDYLEQPGKLRENVRDNLFAPLALANLCRDRGIHMTYMGTGCIFEYDEAIGRGQADKEGFRESDEPNFFGSSYSVVKGFTDRLMHQLEDTVLNVRIRMPIVGYHHPRNFITKITQYAKVCSIPNSMTVLPTLLPYLVEMIERGVLGTMNLTNPGVISHNEILAMYRDAVDPTFTWENFSIEEQDAVLASRRSNNLLDTTRLETMFAGVPGIRVAIHGLLSSWGSGATGEAREESVGSSVWSAGVADDNPVV